jgi:hypothetical protein
MAQILVKDVLWDVLFGTCFRIGIFLILTKENLKFFLKKGKKAKVRLGRSWKLKFGWFCLLKHKSAYLILEILKFALVFLEKF